MNNGLRKNNYLFNLFSGPGYTGIVNCNNLNKNVHIKHALCETIGKDIFNISLIFSKSEVSRSSIFGHGTFLNLFMERVVKDNEIEIKDSTGTMYIYNKISGTSSLYECSELQSKISLNIETQDITLSDKHGNQFFFSNSVYPYKIETKDEKVFNITCLQNNISLITNTDNTFKIEFIYNDELVNEIRYYKKINGQFVLCNFSLISYINYNNKAYIKEIEYKQNDNENNTQITVYKNIFSYDSMMKSLVIKENKTNICHRIIFIGNGVSNYVNGLNDNYDTGLPIVFDYSGLRTRITDYLNNSIFVVLDGNGNTSYVYDSLGNIKYQILNNNLIESKIINYKTNINSNNDKNLIIKSGYFDNLSSWLGTLDNAEIVDIDNTIYTEYKPIIGSKFLKLSKSDESRSYLNTSIDHIGNELDYYMLECLVKPCTSRLQIKISYKYDNVSIFESSQIIAVDQDETQQPWTILVKDITPSKSFNKIEVYLEALDNGIVYVGGLQIINRPDKLLYEYSNGNLVKTQIGDKVERVFYNDKQLIEKILTNSTYNENYYNEDIPKLESYLSNNETGGINIYNGEKLIRKRIYNGDYYIDELFEKEDIDNIDTKITINGSEINREYDPVKGEIKSVTVDDVMIETKLNENKDIIEKKYTNIVNSDVNIINNDYYSNGLLYKSRINNKGIKNEYSDLNELTKVSIYNGLKYSQINSFSPSEIKDGNLDSIKYGDSGDEIQFVYNDNRLPIAIYIKKAGQEDRELIEEIEYDEFKRVKKEITKDNNIIVNIKEYQYDSIGNITSVNITQGTNIYNNIVNYDLNGDLLNTRYVDNSSDYLTVYTASDKLSTFDKRSKMCLFTLTNQCESTFFETYKLDETSEYALKNFGKITREIYDSEPNCDIYNVFGYNCVGISKDSTLSYIVKVNEIITFSYIPTNSLVNIANINYLSQVLNLSINNNKLVLSNSQGVLYTSTINQKNDCINKVSISLINKLPTNPSIIYIRFNDEYQFINVNSISDRNQYGVIDFTDDYEQSYKIKYNLFNVNISDLEKIYSDECNDYLLTNEMISEYTNKLYNLLDKYFYENDVLSEDNLNGEISINNTYDVNTTHINNIKGLENYEIYPLENSLNSLTFKKPQIVNRRITDEFIPNRMFAYKNTCKESMFILDGNQLGYKLNWGDSGNICLNVLFNTNNLVNKDERVIFHLNNNANLKVYKDINNKIVLSAFNYIFNTNLVVDMDEKNFIGLTWYYDEKDGTYFIIKVNDNIITVNFPFWMSGNCICFIGGQNVNNVINNPLYGYVNYLVIGNSYINNDEFNRIKKKTSGIHIINKYNGLGQAVGKEIADNNIIIENRYLYNRTDSNNKEAYTTISNEKLFINENLYSSFNYNYSNGNIIKIKENNVIKNEYEYDFLGELVSEINYDQNKKIIYEYDELGNITKILTTNNLTNEVLDSRIMGYNNDNNPYLLTNVNNKTIKYSNNMYPISYGIYDDNDNLINGYSYTFNGNKLSEIYDKTNNRKIKFKYDSSGKRIEKEVYSYLTLYSIITTYYYENDKLIKEVMFNEGSDESRVINYIYDGDMLIGIEYNNKIWYYLKNINGLIIGLVNSDGVVEAKYNYTAYGEIKVFNNSGDEELNSSFIGNINPLRYKGYYYDVETGLFWLSSRYYSPELCRFISPDSVDYLNPSSINGLNIYAYCNNDPINYADPSGHVAISIGLLLAIGGIVGAAIGAGASVAGQYIANGCSWDNFSWGQLALDTVLGGVSGMLSMSPLGLGAMVAANAGIGFVGAVGGHLINGSDFSKGSTWLDIGLSTGLGAFVGLIGGAGALNAGYLNGAKQTAGFIRAAGLYDDVLTKAVTGFYRTPGIASNALRLSGQNLVKQWNKMVVGQARKALTKALAYGGTALLIGTAGKGRLYDWCNDYF